MNYIIKDLDKMTGQEILDCAEHVIKSNLPHEQKIESLNILLSETQRRAKTSIYNKHVYPFTSEDLKEQ